jgi:hypothetical protein
MRPFSPLHRTDAWRAQAQEIALIRLVPDQGCRPEPPGRFAPLVVLAIASSRVQHSLREH